MKKIFFTIIAIFYLGMSSGIAMEVHYCMGELAGIEFFGDENDECSKCGMKESKNGCCNDEHHFLKISDSHKNVTNNIDFSSAILFTPVPNEDFNLAPQQINVKTKFCNVVSPFDQSLKRCILLCVFRI